MKKIIPLIFLAAVLVYSFYPEKVITMPAGITAPWQPEQVKLSEAGKWEMDGYTIEALASYRIKARVLGRNNFSMDRESDISPFDLALGWGPMSDQDVIDKLDISQRSRWYYWKAEKLPIPASEIVSNSANVHIIPADKMIEERFDKVYKGSLIEMSGSLVKVTAKDGWNWTSSLRRDDSGGGSCELFRVEELIIFDDFN